VSGETNPVKESARSERLLNDFAEEISYAREWLERNNDVTRVVEILNSMKEADEARAERSFQDALKVTFPGSQRIPELEPIAKRKLERFFNYYQLQDKIEVMAFSLSYPMAFNTGQVVGVSDKLIQAWTEAEFSGVVAHEIGHIIAQAEERITTDMPPTNRAYQRAEEIKADWVAMMMFRGAGLGPQTVISGLERIVPPAQHRRAGPLHPPMAVRSVLMREWLALPDQRLRLREALVFLSKKPRNEP
jgi:predicted Zn-dependent protease